MFGELTTVYGSKPLNLNINTSKFNQYAISKTIFVHGDNLNWKLLLEGKEPLELFLRVLGFP